MIKLTDEEKEKGVKYNHFAHRGGKTLFTHDCEECEWMGSYRGFDLYVCRPNVKCLSILARYGNEPNEYVSGIDMYGGGLLVNKTRKDIDAKVAREAIRRAVDCGKARIEIASTFQ